MADTATATKATREQGLTAQTSTSLRLMVQKMKKPCYSKEERYEHSNRNGN